MLTREQLLKAIEGEQNAIAGYEHMKTQTGDEGHIETLNSIIMDEHKHLKSFEELYRRKFGKDPESPAMNPLCAPSFTDCIRRSVGEELESYKFYRDIHIDCREERVKQLFFKAMTDENEHAIRLNTMYTGEIEKRVL